MSLFFISWLISLFISSYMSFSKVVVGLDIGGVQRQDKTG